MKNLAPYLTLAGILIFIAIQDLSHALESPSSSNLLESGLGGGVA